MEKRQQKYDSERFPDALRPSEDIQLLISLAKKVSEEKEDERHDIIAAKVSRRLRLRYAQLKTLEEKARSLQIHSELTERITQEHGFKNQENDSLYTSSCNDKHMLSYDKEYKDEADPKVKRLTPGERAYHLAVTDLFVEKALAYLEDRAEDYKRRGKRAYTGATIAVIIGTLIAFFQMFFPPALTQLILINCSGISVDHITINKIKTIQGLLNPFHGVIPNKMTSPDFRQVLLMDGFLSFARSFTAYGMIVLVAVRLSRYGKSLLDQGEKLLERRHALRQGRLFVHLNDGKLSLEEMEEAFNWNVSGTNAFSDLHTESQAPWGNVLSFNALKEFWRQAPELIKAGVNLVSKKSKKDENSEP